jgi:hypothetical protein
MALKKCNGFGTKKGIFKMMQDFLYISPYCSNCAGKSFEHQIVRSLEIQGCEIKHNLVHRLPHPALEVEFTDKPGETEAVKIASVKEVIWESK